jgi:hypothetical protein
MSLVSNPPALRTPGARRPGASPAIGALPMRRLLLHRGGDYLRAALPLPTGLDSQRYHDLNELLLAVDCQGS